jgi:hypothetical protein
VKLKRGLRAGLVAAVVGVIVGAAFAMPALADDTNAAQRCRALRHGADEIVVCLYRESSDFADMPAVASDDAIALFNAFLSDPIDAACVKRVTGDLYFVQCYFLRDVFEADEGNPAWSSLGSEIDIAGAVLYSPDELTPLDASEPTPQAPAGAVPVDPKLSPDSTPEATPAPSSSPIPSSAPAASDAVPSTPPQPSDTPAPEPSAAPSPGEVGVDAATG